MKRTGILFRLIGREDPNCPSETDVLAFHEDTLPKQRRRQVERHFAGCDDCRDLLAFLGRESDEAIPSLSEDAASEQTRRVLAYMANDETNRREPKPIANAAPGFYISYPKLIAVGLTIGAVAVTAFFLLMRGQSAADSAMDALRLAVKDQRRTEARISGGLDHSAYAGVTRGIETNGDELNFSRARNKIKRAEQENAPVDERLVLARVYLSGGTRPGASQALTILSQLAAGGMETPEALNDTGVAHLQLENYDEAITYFNKALLKSPTYYEALFNRALAEQRAHRDIDAAQDWQWFIDLSPDNGWKDEARSKLNSLRVPASSR